MVCCARCQDCHGLAQHTERASNGVTYVDARKTSTSYKKFNRNRGRFCAAFFYRVYSSSSVGRNRLRWIYIYIYMRALALELGCFTVVHYVQEIPPALWATGGLKPSIFQPTPPSKDPFGEGFTPPLPLPGVPNGSGRSHSSTHVGPLGLFLATFCRIEFLMFFRSLF